MKDILWNCLTPIADRLFFYGCALSNTLESQSPSPTPVTSSYGTHPSIAHPSALLPLDSFLVLIPDHHSRIPMLRARGASLSERRDIIVKRCRGYVEQLQGKSPFKLSTNEIRTLIIKSLSCDDSRERLLSFRDELAGACMEEILQVREICLYNLRIISIYSLALDPRRHIACYSSWRD